MSRYRSIVLLFLLIAFSSDLLYAQKFYEKEVSLPIYFSLKNNQVYKIIKFLKKF